jgi:GntR family negative regulator for fad regulon and positive regulator of fabA
MSDWTRPSRPAELAEQQLTRGILEGEFPIGSSLPAERELAARLGVTRPTLRETLQRLARDGWITIKQGKPTQIKDFWWEGNLNVLRAIVRYSNEIPVDFVPNLLAVRRALAPAYTRAAIEREPETIVAFLSPYPDLKDSAAIFTEADWSLHMALIRASGNPIYMLIYNGFGGFYVEMAQRYFEQVQARESSRTYYAALLTAAIQADPEAASAASLRAMEESIDLWRTLDGGGQGRAVAHLGRREL